MFVGQYGLYSSRLMLGKIKQTVILGACLTLIFMIGGGLAGFGSLTLWFFAVLIAVADVRLVREALELQDLIQEFVDSGKMVFAPFTPEQVDNLNHYQHAGRMHPFTCGNYHDGDHTLVATEGGWICCHCDYTQDWAHKFMCEAEEPQTQQELEHVS